MNIKSIGRVIVFTFAVIGFAACSHNKHKAKKIETQIERAQVISGEEQLGVKDGNLIVQKKVEMGEELRRLQNEVYSLEDRVYGNRKYNSMGLYGKLKSCRLKVSSKKMGGDGKLTFTEPIDRVTDKEDEFEIGIDEKEKIVGVSEEFLKDRITRFRGYRATLQKREDEYEEKTEICDAELASRQHDLQAKKNTKKSAGVAAAADSGDADVSSENSNESSADTD